VGGAASARCARSRHEGRSARARAPPRPHRARDQPHRSGQEGGEEAGQEGAGEEGAGQEGDEAFAEGGLIAAVRRRLDVELVRRGLVPSRTRAVEVIGAGRVLVGGAPASTPARQVDGAEAIALLDADGPEYVSRGGHKLAAAL